MKQENGKRTLLVTGLLIAGFSVLGMLLFMLIPSSDYASGLVFIALFLSFVVGAVVSAIGWAASRKKKVEATLGAEADLEAK